MKRRKIFYILISVLVISISFFVVYASVGSVPKENISGEKESLKIKSFADVRGEDWFYQDVEYVLSHGMMKGTSENEFSPEVSTTRGMIVTILWRMEGEPKVRDGKSFSDVMADSYYSEAVRWATDKKIVSGYDETSFGPEDLITREQMTAILYRYADFKDRKIDVVTDLSCFDDVSCISDYALEAMKWAYANEVIKGISENEIGPQENATRGQVAAILRRVCENIINKNESKEPNPTMPHEVVAGSSGGNTSVGKETTTEGTENESETIKEKPTIMVNSAIGNPGETVEVQLEVKNNPGILGMVLTIEYDETAMRLVEVENGNAFSDVLTMTPSKEIKSGMRFVWDGLELGKNDIKDGTILVLKFEIAETATVGERYAISFRSDDGDIVDSNLNLVNAKHVQGYIELKSIN